MGCRLCPRKCDADRVQTLGFCGAPQSLRVARAALHFYEEPPISGARGSGTVFFSGCSLRCVYCQNSAIRAAESGKELSVAALADIFLALQAQGAHNVNLVTPTHYADQIAEALRLAKPRLEIPVVYNCGGYECVESLRMLEGLVDIYLPDFKYISPEAARAYSAASDYAAFATAALAEMHRQTGAVRFDGEGVLRTGVVVRHLVLPGGRRDSMAVLDRIAETVPVADIRLSLMRQYTPDFCPESAPKELKRRVTSFEYEQVMQHAIELGFEGYFQTKEAVGKQYTPDFSEQVLPTV